VKQKVSKKKIKKIKIKGKKQEPVYITVDSKVGIFVLKSWGVVVTIFSCIQASHSLIFIKSPICVIGS